MTEAAMTKTDFARLMGVDRAQPTRWAQMGMPVLPDGRVDPVEAAEWVRENVASTQRDRRSVGMRSKRGWGGGVRSSRMMKSAVSVCG